jgi:uncharacterized protein (DUF58 family)
MLKIKKSAIFILIASFLLARLGGWEIPHLMFYMVLGVIIVSFLWSGRITKKVSAYQRIDQRDYYVDEKLEVNSYIDNDSLLPIPHIEIIDRTEELISGEMAKPTITSLFPTEREIIHKAITAKYRGLYDLGPIDIATSDALGIITRKRRIFSDTSIKVYPRIHKIEKINLKSMQSYGTLTTKQKAFEDNSIVSDIRKYSPGDSIKRIHWKVSAKKGDLLIKNYEMTGSAATYVFLDFKKNCYKGENIRNLEEKAVEVASSTIFYLLNNSVSIEMYINSASAYYTKGRDIKELVSFMDIFCEIKTDGNKTMKDVLEKRIRLISKGSTVIVITGDINEEEAIIYGSIKNMGYDIILIYVGDFEIKDEIKNTISSYNVKINVINSHSDIKGVLESI